MPPKEATSFWFTPRHILHPSRCDDEFHNAVLRSNIIYGGPLMILDSDLIHNRRVRDGLKRGDPFFRGLFENGLLRIAMRREADGTVDICRTAVSLQAPGTAITEIGKEYYLDARDLQSVVSDEENVGCHYMLDQVRSRYRNEVTRLFGRLSSQQALSRGGLPRDMADAVYQYLVSLPEQQNVSWSTFLPDSALIKRLSAFRFGRRSIDTYSETIFRIARGPYVTMIPDSVSCPAIFSAEDRQPIDLYRGRENWKTSEPVRSEIQRNGLSLADHVRGLNMLTADGLYKLITSPQKDRLDRTIAEASQNQHSLSEVGLAIAAYLRLVDFTIAEPLARPEPVLFQTEVSLSASTEAKSAFRGAIVYTVKEVTEQYVPGAKQLITGIVDSIKPIYDQRLRPLMVQHLGLDAEPVVSTPITEAEQAEAIAEARERFIADLNNNSVLNPRAAQTVQLPNSPPIQITKGLYEVGESFTPSV